MLASDLNMQILSFKSFSMLSISPERLYMKFALKWASSFSSLDDQIVLRNWQNPAIIDFAKNILRSVQSS